MKTKVLKVAAALGICSLLMLRANLSYGAVNPAQVRLPDFFAKSISSVCSLRVEISQPDVETRKEALEKLLEASYQETQKWRYYYNISGIDYEKFSSFYVIGYGPCLKSQSRPEAALNNFLGRGRWTWSRHIDESLVSNEAILRDNLNPITLFKKFYPDVDIQACLVTLNLRSDVPVDKYSETYDKLRQAWRMYRLPFYIVGWSGDKVFVLFSRYCDKKPEIMHVYMNLISKTDNHVNDVFKPPQYDTGKSDFYNYLSISDPTK